MKASRNELTALFKLAFEGLGFDLGGYENAADMIIWGQMHGLNSFDAIENRITALQKRKNLSLQKLTPASTAYLTIDAKGNSSIVAAPMAFDICYVEAISHGKAKVTIENCYDRALAIKKLVDCNKKGVACLSYWRDQNQLHFVQTVQGHCCPQYRQYPLNAFVEHSDLQAQHQQSLFVFCATDQQALQAYITEHFADINSLKVKTITAETMKTNFQQALTHGTEIKASLWQTLATLGKTVLVESTEQSRMGAGA